MVECLDEGVVACLGEVVFRYLDNNNKGDFDVDIRHILDDCFRTFLLAHPLEYILEETLGGPRIVHCGYMKKVGWYETCVQIHHEHK